VLANTSIDVNSTTNIGNTPIWFASTNDHLDAAKLLVESGANLFLKNSKGESAMIYELGPQVLQHAKDLIWVSVKPLLLLSSACSTSTPSTALIKVFSISGLIRDYIAPYVMRKNLIIRDPEEDVDEEPEPDDVKLRIEAGLAAASTSSMHQLQQQVQQLKQQLLQQHIQSDGELKPGVKVEEAGLPPAASSSSSSCSTSNKRAREE
jgi:hypothetical protein